MQRSAKTEKKVHPIKDVLSDFDQCYFDRFGVRAPIIGGKDSKLAQRLLQTYSREQLRAWLPVFFGMRDKFIEQSGYTFGVFASCIGKVIAAAERPRVGLKDKTVRTLQGIYGDPIR